MKTLKSIIIGATLCLGMATAAMAGDTFEKNELLKQKAQFTQQLKVAQVTTNLQLETIEDAIKKLRLLAIEYRMKFEEQAQALSQKLTNIDDQLKKLDGDAKAEAKVEKKKEK